MAELDQPLPLRVDALPLATTRDGATVVALQGGRAVQMPAELLNGRDADPMVVTRQMTDLLERADERERTSRATAATVANNAAAAKADRVQTGLDRAAAEAAAATLTFADEPTAIAGIVDNKGMSPLRVKQSIVANAKGGIWRQSGTGAVDLTIEQELRANRVSIDQFYGGSGSYRTAFGDAVASLGSRGGIIELDAKFYDLSGGDITLPQGVYLRGKSLGPGETPYDWDYQKLGTVLLVDGTAGDTIVCGHNTGIIQCTILRKGLTTPADAIEAAAGVAAFAGRGVTVSGSDVVLDRLLIVGFETAVYHTGSIEEGAERPRFSWVMFDCTNGISLGAVSDLGWITNCRGFPFYTAHRPWTTSALVTRSGTAFYSRDFHDWGEWSFCNSYGWLTGFHIHDSDNTGLVSCGVDGIQNAAGGVGFKFTGGCRDARLIGCKSTLQTGYKFDFNGSAVLSACSAWGTDIHVDVVAGNVDLTDFNFDYLRAGGGTGALRMGSGAGFVNVRGGQVDNSIPTYPGDPFIIDSAVATKFKYFGTRFINSATSKPDWDETEWKAWTPAVSAGTGTITSYTLLQSRYRRVGDTVTGTILLRVDDNGTGAASLIFIAPTSVKTTGAGAGRSLETGKSLQAQIFSDGSNQIRVFNYDNSYPVGTNHTIVVSFEYEAA